MQNFLSKTGDMSNPEEAQYGRPKRPIGWTQVKLLHGLLTATKYGLSLILMLVAMTYNPTLFIALFVGYWVGDFVFCDNRIDSLMHKNMPMYDNGGFAGTIIRWALLVPIDKVPVVRAYLYDDSKYAELMTGYTEPSYVTKYTPFALWLTPRLISLIYLVILLVWIVEAEGGFGYTENNVFGWHALLMSFFVVIFMNEALLTYKAPLVSQLANDRKYLRLVIAY